MAVLDTLKSFDPILGSLALTLVSNALNILVAARLLLTSTQLHKRHLQIQQLLRQISQAIVTQIGRNIGFQKSFVEHGYIIGLASARADLSYQQCINKMWNRRTRFYRDWETDRKSTRLNSSHSSLSRMPSSA